MTDIQVEGENEAPVAGQLDGEGELAREIMTNLKRARGNAQKWRTSARESFDFFSGVQWTEEDIGYMDKQGRPSVVFNRIVRTINAVSGVEVQNRQEVTYLPRRMNINQQNPKEVTQDGYADMLNHAAKWVRDECDAEDEESEAFQDVLICGTGFTETRLDYDENPEGMIVKSRIDPLMVLVDPDSVKRNFIDAKWIAVIKEYDRKEAREMFPEIQNIQTGSFWSDQDMLVHDFSDQWLYKNDYSDQLNKVDKVTVVQYQYWRKEDVYAVLTPDGNIVHLPAERYKKLANMIAAQGLKAVKMKKKVYKQCFLVGNDVPKKDMIDLGCDHFTIQGITGIRDRNRNYWFGLVEIMKDPQRWANKWLSQIQYIMNSNAKGGLLIEEGAVKSQRDLEDDWSDPSGIIVLNPGGLSKFKQKDPAPYPDGFDRLMQYAINAINDIPGVNLEMMGMAARDQPIGLEMTRKDAGITVLSCFFDSLRRYRKIEGRILAYFIREYLADGRLIRILGENGREYLPLIKSQLAFEYDIVVDESPTSHNSKDKTFLMLTKVLPMAMEAQIPIPKEILDYSPLPMDLVQKWKALIAEQEQASQPSPEDMAMHQEMKQIAILMQRLGAQQAEADVNKTQSETVKNYATAEKDKSVGNEQNALAAQKFGVARGAQDMKNQAIIKDQQRKDIALMLNEHRKDLELHLENALKHKKMGIAPSLNQIH